MYLQIRTIRNPWNFQRKCGGKAMLRGGGVLQAQLEVVFTSVFSGPLILFVPDYSNYSWMHDNQARFQFTSMRDREISQIQVDGVDDGSDWQRRIGCSVFIVVSKQEKSILFRTKSLGLSHDCDLGQRLVCIQTCFMQVCFTWTNPQKNSGTSLEISWEILP